MKKALLLVLIVWALATLPTTAQQVYTITNSGLNFTPDALTITLNDTVAFSVGPNHPVREVTQATYNSNGTTLKQGGFSFSDGQGKAYFTSVGTYYYVCVPHVTFGMKGTITVTPVSSVEIANAPSISIYPNPVVNTLQINLKGTQARQIIINDLSGQTVANQPANSQSRGVLSFNTTNWPRGIYLARIVYANGTFNTYTITK